MITTRIDSDMFRHVLLTAVLSVVITSMALLCHAATAYGDTLPQVPTRADSPSGVWVIERNGAYLSAFEHRTKRWTIFETQAPLAITDDGTLITGDPGLGMIPYYDADLPVLTFYRNGLRNESVRLADVVSKEGTEQTMSGFRWGQYEGLDEGSYCLHTAAYDRRCFSVEHGWKSRPVKKLIAVLIMASVLLVVLGWLSRKSWRRLRPSTSKNHDV